MKNWLIPAALLSLVSCSRSPTMLVTVSNVPPGARSLQIEAAHDGFATAVEIEPYELPEPTPVASTFLLRLPANFSGDLSVGVGAFNMAAGKGCLVGTGSNNTADFQGPDASITVSLDAVNDAACTGKKPILLGAEPGFGKTAGGEMVKLTGWGFRPDGTVTMGTKSATYTFSSASQVTVTTPKGAGFGFTAIRYANKDGTFDTRKDLFRFFSDTLGFTTIPLQNSSAFNDTSGFAAAVFDPATTIDLAIALPGTPGRVRIEFTANGAVLSTRQANYTVGNNPGPIVAADFDKDGDLDLIVANIGDGTAQLLKNDGTGIFTVEAPFSVGGVGSDPVAMAQGDLNGDGTPDLVVTNKRTGMGTGQLRVFTNQGNGTMQEIANSPFNVGAEPVSVALGDLNGDSQRDILIACQADDEIVAAINVGPAAGLYVNSGGTMLNLSPVGCDKPSSVKLIDVDSNGKDDLLISCTDSNRVHVVKNNGFPNIAEYQLTTDAMPRNMMLTDLNGDGVSDLIVPAQGANRVNIFVNKQGAGFEGVNFTTQNTNCPQPYQIEALDVDNDGRVDLGVAGLGGASGCLALLFNQSM